MDIFNKYHIKKIEGEEKVIKIIHRHWFDILSQFLVIFLMVLVLLAGAISFPFVFSDYQGADSYNILLFLITTFLLIIWIYSFLIWIDYYFDMWIVTSERIVNIEQRGFFMRTVSEMKLAKIQDVTTDVKGLLPTVINFGDIHIQTAGEEGKFFFRRVPDPYGIKNLLMELLKRNESERINEIGELIEKMK